MSRELFKETFFPLGIDDFTVYNWFLNENRHWRVFKEGSENVSTLNMVHIATTRGKDELLYFNEVAENNKPIFNNVEVIFHDNDIKYALEDSVYDDDGDDVLVSGHGFSWNGEHTNERRFELDDCTEKVFGDAVEPGLIFSSGLKVFCTVPHEYFGTNNKYKNHLKTMLDIHELYYTKNKDYGDAFTQSLDKYGPIAALVRMEDKLNRLSNLISKGQEGYIKSESVEDTLIDLANYAIMTALYLRGKETD